MFHDAPAPRTYEQGRADGRKEAFKAVLLILKYEHSDDESENWCCCSDLPTHIRRAAEQMGVKL